MSTEAPDLLERLGRTIHEVGAVQFSIEAVERWPDGARLVLAAQNGLSGGPHALELEVRHGEQVVARRTLTLEGDEGRRLRLPLTLQPEVSALALHASQRPSGEATRRRQPWFKFEVPAAPSSPFGVLGEALGWAVGKRPPKFVPIAPPELRLDLPLETRTEAPPIATEEEAFWQAGMELPREGGLVGRAAQGFPAPDPAANAVAPSPAPPPQDEFVACPDCGARVSRADAIGAQRCTSCDAVWRG